MASIKITDLNHQSAFADDDLFLIVDVGNDETRKLSYANLVNIVGNVHVVEANVDAVESRRDSNVTEQTAIEARRVANIAGAVSTITTGDLTVSRALVSSGSGKVAVSDITSTELGHLDGVSTGIQTQLDAKAALAGATFTGQVNMSDDLVVTGNLTVNGATTTVSTTNLDVEDRMIMLADGASGAPSLDVGLLFNRGNQGNAAIFYDESGKTFRLSDTKDPKSNTAISPVTASNLDVGILTAATINYNGADLNTSITDNVSTLNTSITALEARRAANVTIMTNEDTALQARIAANTLTAAANDFATFTRLNANLDIVQDNVAAITAGVSPSNILHTTSTANSYATGSTTTTIDAVLVYLNGVYQSENQYVLGNSTHNVQFKDASLVSGLELEIRKF